MVVSPISVSNPEGGKLIEKISVSFVAVTSFLACLICIGGLGLTLYDYFDTSSKPLAKTTVKPETKNVEKRVQIVALGDSLTRGTGDSEGKGYVGNLVADLEKKPPRSFQLTIWG